ncbi:MAG: gph [Rhodospirillales bacterium]|jgi:phosphoglycolate phosphatase|nr:gph [Rhodospirillales bacterium]
MGADLPAVIFDLDGTLIDSALDLQILVNRLLARTGRAALDLPSIVRMIGDGTTALVERAFRAGGGPGLSPPELETFVTRFIEDYERKPVRWTRSYPGVKQTLELLRSRGHRLAVCTNKLERLACTILRDLDLERFFDAVIGGDAVGARKPDPASLFETVRRLGRDIGSGVVMVGDSAADAGAARAAGVPVVLVGYGYSRTPLASLSPNALIAEFAALPDALEILARDVASNTRDGSARTDSPPARASAFKGA